MISLGDRTEPGLWRPPVVKTVAAQKEGLDELMESLDKHYAFIEAGGELRRRRERRAADEIEAIALESLRARFGRFSDHGALGTLASRVVDGQLDPYAAADLLVDQLDI
jgi:LAO/AO transport system kinase